jgi:hypothetical protein
MPRHRVSASAVVRAPAGRVYAILADYRHGHPRIVPRPPFGPLEVEQGGTGAGTVVRFQMRLLGRTRTFRAAVTEPEPGRVLVETDLGRGAVTTFTVDPCGEGQGARVDQYGRGDSRRATRVRAALPHQWLLEPHDGSLMKEASGIGDNENAGEPAPARHDEDRVMGVNRQPESAPPDPDASADVARR